MKGLSTGRFICAVIALVILAAAVCAQEPLRVRRNFFGCHNLMDGGPAYTIGIDWTAEMNGPGFVFDWVRGDYEVWMAYCFQRGLIPCMRLQNGNGGDLPDAGYMGNVVSVLCNYKLTHPQYADRLVYLQLWNEPGDNRDLVEPAVFSQFMIDAWNNVQSAVNAAAQQNPAIAGTFKIMTPGQNGPAWWEEAWAAHPQAKFCFDVWGTHPYPESDPPSFNHHDGVAYPSAVKTIDSYVLDLDKLAQNHGGYSRRGVPVMITETCYGEHLGISYEGYPKTTRDMAASYYQEAFTEEWYKWPEILAVHHFILCNLSWDPFALVSKGSGSTDTDGDGVLEPTAPYPQYTTMMNTRKSLEQQGKLAPARISKYTGPVGSISGTVTRRDTGGPVKYASLYTDGYEFGNVSLYDGGYAIKDVPVGTYTLGCHKNAYVDASQQITVTANQNTVANFDLVYSGKDAVQFYFVDTAQGPCSGCQLSATFLGQTFTTGSDYGYLKYAAAKPNVGGLYLRFTVIDGANPNGAVVGSFTSYYLEPEFAGEMIGGEAPGDGIPVLPNHTYFLKIERTDGQPVYLYASGSNPYAGGNAWVGNTQQTGWDLYGCYRANRLAVATVPVAPTVTDDGAYTSNLSQIHTSWTCADQALEYQYSIGHTAGDTSVLGWTPAGTQTSITRSLALQPGVRYVVNVKARNSAGWGAVGSSDGILGATPFAGIGGLRTAHDSDYVAVAGKVISRKSTDAFWVQEPDRSSGIRVSGVTSAAEGSRVNVSGWIESLPGGERSIAAPEVTGATPGPAPAPLGIANSSLCGTGLNNVGLLVRLWGRVTQSSSDSFVIDDGSVEGGVKIASGSLAEPPANHYVMITGIAGLEAAGTGNRAVLHVVRQTDIQDPDAPLTGTVSGRVTTGSTGLASATVVTTTGGYSTTTDSGGYYTLGQVSPGTYSVTASKSGYVPQTNNGVSVAAGQITTSNFSLSVQQPFSGITNGTFEGGWFNDPDGDHQSGNGWHRFTTAGVSKSGGDYGQYHSSHWAQTIYESNWTAGLYQQATNAIVGNSYTASVWVKGVDTSLRFWVGIDPLGGTSATSPNVQWTLTDAIPGATWTQITKTVAAQASTITMFIKAQNSAGANRNAWIDDATFVAN